MCLTTISKKPTKLKTYKQRVGWKRLGRIGKESFYFAVMWKLAPRYKWLHETKKLHIKARSRDSTCKSLLYKPHFHIYLKKPDPNCPFVKKVRFRKPVATGYHFGLPVVVASWLRVD